MACLFLAVLILPIEQQRRQLKRDRNAWMQTARAAQARVAQLDHELATQPGLKDDLNKVRRKLKQANEDEARIRTRRDAAVSSISMLMAAATPAAIGGTGRLVAGPALKALIASSGAVRRGGSTAEFKVDFPNGEMVSTDQPIFRWSPMPDATSYRVRVVASGTSEPGKRAPDFHLREEVSGTSWSAHPSLERGVRYSWTVTALKSGRELATVPRSGAEFQLLSSKDLALFNTLKQSCDGSPETLGILYARFGLLHEADTELRKAKGGGPASTIAQTVRHQLEAGDLGGG